MRARLEVAEVGFSAINDIADVFVDPQIVAREAIVKVADSELGQVRMQGVVPRFSATPCPLRAAGPALGQHNDEVWRAYGFTPDEIADMRRQNII